jgi:hypothetical protein
MMGVIVIEDGYSLMWRFRKAYTRDGHALAKARRYEPGICHLS